MSRNQHEGRYIGHYGSHLRSRSHAGPPSGREAFFAWGERNGDMLMHMPKRRAWTSKFYIDKASVAKLKASVLATIERHRIAALQCTPGTERENGERP